MSILYCVGSLSLDFVFVCLFFFFQAEDGIRDAQESRGLGDVYKRQLLVSLSREMRRVFEYHGAEHQSIHLLEDGYPLEPQWALREGTDHLRCGTSFMLLVLVITVVVYSFLGKPPLWLRITERVAIIPLVAGISYEIMKYADRSRSPWMQALAAPGMALQRLTTRRPDLELSLIPL